MSKNYIISGLGIEIFYKDLPDHKLWSQYNSLCLALRGDGWRAPTLVELRGMYELHLLGSGNFLSDIYWSSDIPLDSLGRSKDYLRYCVNFNGGFGEWKSDINLVYNRFRPVRSI